MDEADRANEEEATVLAFAMKRISPAKELPYVGRCYNCSASTPDGHRFCDADCRDDWQGRMDAARKKIEILGGKA